jgi:hypothetical protein
LSRKSDAIDAEHAARTVLAGGAVVIPKLADGQIEAIRLVKIARDTAVKAHTAAIITLKAVLVTAPQELRDELEPLTDFNLSPHAPRSIRAATSAIRASRFVTRCDHSHDVGLICTRRSRSTRGTSRH